MTGAGDRTGGDATLRSRARSSAVQSSRLIIGWSLVRIQAGPSVLAELAGDSRQTSAIASYKVNNAAVRHAKRLIESRQYVLDSDWGDAQPAAEDENAYLAGHSWDEYAEWHLGLTEGASDETKARYAFVYGDFRRLHRTGLIACVYRAAEWRHKDVELAAHRLLQLLDKQALKR